MTLHDESLRGLNPEQRQAVEHTGGPLLILAGAGSGKTRVITHRIARLVADGAHPASIFAVTFTNKAAREMRERAIAIAGPAAESVQVSTFHSACARILRRNAHRFGLDRAFSIYDQDDQRVLLRELAEQLGMAHDAAAVRDAAARIEAAKNDALDVHDARTAARDQAGEAFADLYAAYQQALHRANACDFGDLIALVVRGLRGDPSFAERMRATVRHLLVDEFQDTNTAQFELIKLLAPESGDVAAVGDDDQAIYGWRGATVANVRRFRDELPGCTTIALEQNYRSGPTILDVSHSVVASLPERLDKHLRTDRTDREPVRVFVGSDDIEEADFVARQIERLRREHELEYHDFAVFFRTNAQSRVIEERLRHHGVPHALRGAQSWFDKREIRDALAYLRLAANPADEVAFRRVANVPARGLGKGTLRKVIQLHDEGGATGFGPALRASADAARRLQARTRAGLIELADLLDSLHAMAAHLPPDEVLEAALTESGYTEWLRTAEPLDADERIRNLDDLLESAREFARADADATVHAFVEKAALAGADEDEDTTRVELMTVHAAKGLEFPVVFVTGLEEGAFPLARRGDVDDPDEERRLCYVAFTRAERLLYVSAAMRRRLFGQSKDTDPSPFLTELDPAHVAILPESSSRTLDWRAERRTAFRAKARREPEFEFDQRPWQERHGGVPVAGLIFGADIGVAGVAGPDPADEHDPGGRSGASSGLAGRRVRHRSFGVGTVVDASEIAGKTTLTIDFPGETEASSPLRKQVLRKYVDLLD